MAFREKIAWISMLTTIIVWGGFFGYMLVTWGQAPGHAYLIGFIAAVVIQAVLAIIASIVTAAFSPSDAQAGSDERDRAIARRSYSFAYPVLLTAVLCVAASIHLGAKPRDMAYGIMAAIIIAEIVHYGVQILSYRRGWHG